MDQMGRLEDVLALRDAVYARLSAYLRLRNQLEPLKVANQPSLKTQVDIGSSVFMQARVADASKVFIDVGCQTFVPMTLPDALKFIDFIEARLTESAQRYTDQALQLRAKLLGA